MAATPQHVPQSRLSGQQKRQLQAVLRKGASAFGYPTDLWACARVAEVIEQRFGIEYHPGHVSRLLYDLGYSCQEPTARARKRDEAAAERFRNETWQQVKKGRKTAS